MDYGFVRVAAAVPRLKVANCGHNAAIIMDTIKEAQKSGAQIVVFPELSLTAYTCGDLFHQHALLIDAENQLGRIILETADVDIIAIIGMPITLDNQLFNCAVAIQDGKILGAVPKTYIPGYKEFYEERWFASSKNARSGMIRLCGQDAPFGADLLFEAAGCRDTGKGADGSPICESGGAQAGGGFGCVCFGVEICEDLWAPIPPSSYQAVAGAHILFNLSASNELIGKYEYRQELVRQQSGKCVAGYVYTSSGVEESTTDVVYGGHALVAENGALMAESERFSRKGQLVVTEIDVQKLINDRFKNTSFMEAVYSKSFRKIGCRLAKADFGHLYRHIDACPFVPSDIGARDKRCQEIFAIQTSGLAKRMEHTGSKNAVIGISGGLDSTLALLVTARTFDLLGMPRKDITAVTMPGFGTTDHTYENAVKLIKTMGAGFRETDIREACLRHFSDIGHDPAIHDVTYENVQARERTQILMDIANKQGGLVIGTGDLSELALGWCTYNGDHMSMYAVNCSIPKTLVRYLVRWAADNVVEKEAADVLCSILDTPITPELLPPDESGGICQKTEDIIGPYELHDFFLYHAVRYGAPPEKLLYLAERAFSGVYGADTIKSWLKVFYRRFFSQQFKRSCLPDGPKVGTISLSPRGDWRMPSDADAETWLKRIG